MSLAGAIKDVDKGGMGAKVRMRNQHDGMFAFFGKVKQTGLDQADPEAEGLIGTPACGKVLEENFGNFVMFM